MLGWAAEPLSASVVQIDVTRMHGLKCWWKWEGTCHGPWAIYNTAQEILVVAVLIIQQGEYAPWGSPWPDQQWIWNLTGLCWSTNQAFSGVKHHEWGADTSSILGLVQLSNFRFKAHSVSAQELTTEGEHGWLWHFPKEGSLGVSTLRVTTSSTALVSTYPQQRTLACLVAL